MCKVRSTWRLIEDRIHYVCFFGTAKGGKAFRDITMPFVGYPQKLQWDGKHMALNAGGTIYQMQVSGSRGKIVGTTGLRGDTEGGGTAWIAGDTVLGPYGGESARRVGGRNTIISDINLSEPTQK